MKQNKSRELASALIGLGSLLIYILACTSFSPDDSKVLYATVDAKSGMTGVAVYDRKSGKSELLFQPFLQDMQTPAAKPAMLRPQWIEDGHSFLTTWRAGSGDSSDTTLDMAIVPFDRRGPVRIFRLADLSDNGVGSFFYWPVPVIGKYLFLLGQSNSIIRLDIGTGEMHRETNQPDLVLLPSPDNDRLFYLSNVNNSDAPSEFGLLDPETFARKPMFHIAEGDQVSPWAMAMSQDARTFAYQTESDKTPVIHLLEADKPARILPLSLTGDTEINIRQFSTKGDLLYAAYMTTEGTNTEYGFMEIPLDGSQVRKTALITNAPGVDIKWLGAFQIDLSHDGKTLAVESLWLYDGENRLKAEDCALFLVDLSNPERKVTKVPIPLPPKEQPVSNRQ